MNKHQAQLICTQLNIGIVISLPAKVLGGLLHTMWKLETPNGSFACKQLNININLNEQARHAYELSEHIAQLFRKHGIPAITALSIHNEHLINVDGSTFLVYPWSNATVLPAYTISKKHALKIAELLANMHKINLQIPGLDEPKLHVHQSEKIKELIQQAEILDMPFAQELKNNEALLLTMNKVCQSDLPLKHTKTIVSHGDLDQKNVLWDADDNPVIVDWESAGKVNQSQEVIDVALNWSGITTPIFNKNIYLAMITAYIKSGGYLEKNDLEHAFISVINNWLHWLVHNLECSLKVSQNHQKEQEQYTEQIHQVVRTITLLQASMPELIINTENIIMNSSA